uniref:E3 ubiquitin-protein ligase PPP1R11 n=1 Tax=Meloidogyne incognita TaxID=6306 RepID=A0A914L4H3_MELIC
MQSSSPRHDNNSAITDVESRGSGTTTITQVNQPEDNTENGNHLLLRLEQPSTSENTTERNSPRVQWTEDTVDNENLGKRKSKCCCIFKKKRDWNDSDSSDEDCESDHCRGHKGKAQKPEGGGGGDDHDGGPPVQT